MKEHKSAGIKIEQKSGLMYKINFILILDSFNMFFFTVE